jgi:hypothetical protein
MDSRWDPLTAETLLRTMRGALAEEREGIQRMDPSAIERANAMKERVIRGLHAIPAADRGPLLDALDTLQPELRRNLILLTQARAYLAQTQLETRQGQREASGLLRRSFGDAGEPRVRSIKSVS